MAVKVLVTGATGFIGGSVFSYIYKAHSGKEFEYRLLIRDQARAKVVKDKYPNENVRVIYGTLEDFGTVEKAAAEADIVIHTADSSDNVAGATAIAKGLKAGHTSDNPAYYFHTTGTGILTWDDDLSHREGEAPQPEQTYSDVDGVDRLLTLPDKAWHRDVDKRVQHNISDAVRTAMICPPTIYGVGSGECIKCSDQIPNLIRYILKHGYGPIIGKGKTEWDNVHINDLADLFLRVFNAALDPVKQKDPEIFGPKAYFFAVNGVHNWANITRKIAEMANKPTKVVTLKEVMTSNHGKRTWGLNSKGVAQRAKKYLDWEPKHAPLEDTLAEALEIERRLLGL